MAMSSCQVVSHLEFPILEELDLRVPAEYKDPAVQIIDENDRIPTWPSWISTMD